ncbi:hypothetical protein JQ607_09820 [Bradyrhizobium liaoningense]|uniref:hypothetical protein n=1 Tax=Bradyrhizobium liaoningense TaxID=43992 RepID=UPI001BA88570|nr:hypothetical protein [Bradyrhizobium liaoningense]MBR0840483.1 hypothetical protein [Bradyrhizobium liaoningense]
MSPEKLSRFKEELERRVAEMAQRQTLNAPAGFTGEEIDAPLEHTVRIQFLDHLLRALGWKVEAVVEEARVKGDTTLFLDYLGVHVQQRTPILIFEAKAWDKPPISAISSANRRDAPEVLLAKALTFVRDGKGASPVTAEWTGWLSKLRDYVRDLQSQSRHLVSKVAISSGQWLVIFTDTRNAFIDDGAIDPNFILVFRTAEYVAASDDIFRQLAYDTLVKSIPSPLRPTQLSAYIAASDVRRAFHAIVVTWQASGSDAVYDRFPQIIVNPAAVLERADGELLHVTDHQLGHEFVPTDVERLREHFFNVRQKAERLLGSVADALGTTLVASDIDLFRGFPSMPTRGSTSGLVPEPIQERVNFLLRFPGSSREFLLVTGRAPHFLVDNRSFHACMGHDWTACSAAGHSEGPSPILSSNIEPKAYFQSGQAQHCAHRAIHDRRTDWCYVSGFEKFLCCKACVFQEACWPEPHVPPLPCHDHQESAPEDSVAEQSA